MQNPVCGTDPGLPDALKNHLNDLFNQSLRISALADALNAIVDAEDMQDLATAIAQRLAEATSDLSHGLDSVAIDRVLA